MGKKLGREDWQEVSDKIDRDLKHAEDTEKGIAIAKICQAYLLKFVEKELAKFPPAIVKDETERAEKTQLGTD